MLCIFDKIRNFQLEIKYNIFYLKYIYIYRVQSKVVRRPFSLQPLFADVYFQLQNWFKNVKIYVMAFLNFKNRFCENYKN